MSNAEALAPETTDPVAERSSTTEDPAPRAWLFGLLVFVLSLAVYFPALEGPFIWDDKQLLESPNVQELRPLSDYFTSPFWTRTELEPEGRSYYRPLTILSLAVDHAIYGENSSGFHLTNMLLHGINAILVFALIRRVGASVLAATVGALLFAWFPRLTEAAAWISGRTDLLASSFALAALLALWSEHKARRWITALLILLGLFAKEVALAAALGVVVYEWRQGAGKALPKRLMPLVPLAVVGAIYFALRWVAVGPQLNPGSITWGDRSLAAFEAIGRYGFLLLDGWQPRVQIGFLGAPSYPFVIAGVVLLLLLVVFGVRFVRRATAEELALLGTFLGAIGLVCHVLPIDVNIVAADRFVYLPLAALVPLVAARWSRSERPLHEEKADRLRVRPELALGFFSLIALSYLPATWSRAQKWSDSLEFWSTAFEEQKTFNAMSRVELGNLYASNGLFDHAARIYASADPLDISNYAMTVHNRALLLLMEGDVAGCLELLESLAQKIQSPKLSASLASAYLADGNGARAKKLLDELNAEATYYASAEEPRRLLPELGKLQARIKSTPQTPDQRFERAVSLAQLGLSRPAMREFLVLVEGSSLSQARLSSILNFAFDYGRIEEIERVLEFAKRTNLTLPGELDHLLSLRREMVTRLLARYERLGLS